MVTIDSVLLMSLRTAGEEVLVEWHAQPQKDYQRGSRARARHNGGENDGREFSMCAVRHLVTKGERLAAPRLKDEHTVRESCAQARFTCTRHVLVTEA